SQASDTHGPRPPSPPAVVLRCCPAAVQISGAVSETTDAAHPWGAPHPSCRRVGECPGSAEATGDVVERLLVLRVLEDRGGLRVLDELAGLAGALDVEERRLVRHAGGLLHVVRDDD